MTLDQHSPARTGRRASVLALLLGVALMVPMAPASAAGPDAWTGPYGDAGNATNNAGESAITAATAGRVSTAWTTVTRSATSEAPVVTGGVALRVTTTGSVAVPSHLESLSPVTGALLGSIELPAGRGYSPGIAVAGRTALLPFHGFQRPGGVVAVDLDARRVLWTADLPPASISWMGNQQAGRPSTDGQRVYVSGAGNVLNAYRVSDGRLLWTAPHTTNVAGTPNGIEGIAVGSGVVYTGGAEGVIAYEATTGRRLWSSQAATGKPVVAGGRVLATTADSRAVVALAAGGCGSSACSPLWSRSVAPSGSRDLVVGGADASTLFVTYTRPGQPGTGHVARLGATTGQVEWTASVGRAALGLVRGGDTVWLNNEFIAADGTISQRIVGFSARATTATPLRTIPLPRNLQGFPQNLGIAAGTLFQQPNGGILVGYRVAAGPVPAPNTPPTAAFTVTTNGLSVLVDGTPSRDPDGAIASHAWDFGDGTTSVSTPAATTYRAPGTYRITLTVTDSAGATGTSSQTVTVGAPAPAGVVAADAFERTLATGLGTADVGGAWTPVYGANRQSVSGGAAQLAFTAPGTSVEAHLPATARAGADVTTTVALGQTPTGGGVSFAVIGRRTDDGQQYRLRTRFLADGSLRLAATAVDGSERVLGAEVTVSGYRPGTPVQLRFRVTSSGGTTTLQAKAWTGSAEPTAWTLSRTDSTAALQEPGSVGLAGYLSSSAQRSPLTLVVPEFRAVQ